MVKKKQILSPEEIQYLKQLYYITPRQYHNQDVNLYQIYKSYITNIADYEWTIIKNKLHEFHGSDSPLTNYFLEYKIGSKARNHQDNPDTVDGTGITLLDKSSDLIGGDILIGRSNSETVLPQEIGETIYYDTAVNHGVSEVSQGTRLVLVTWFRKKTWQK